MIEFKETLHGSYGQFLRVDRELYRLKTDHQDLVIFENAQWGKVMALDGIVQTTSRDNFIYHEMLVHVPVLAHGRVRDVLIIGGGDGGTLREAVKHDLRATMVELDRSVIDLARTHLPELSDGAFDSPRAEVVIANGVDFVETTDRRFDVIIVDSSDPVGPSAVLFTESFYRGCKRCLREGGVLVTQNGVPQAQGEEVTQGWQRLRPSFADVWFYTAAVPTYYGGDMAFGWATDDATLRRHDAATIRQRHEASGVITHYYNPDLHVGRFALSGDILALMHD